VLGALVAPAHAQTLSPSQAARQDASAFNPSTRSGLTTPNAARLVPTPGGPSDCAPSQATMQSYFGSGNTDLSGKATAMLGSAAAGKSGECAAINTVLQRGSSVSPLQINPSDPIVTRHRQNQQAPMANLSGMQGIFVPQTSSQCVPGTVSGPGDASQEVCYETATLQSSSCERPRAFEIQPWWEYSCLASNQVLVQSTCTKQEAVSVNWVDSCAQGSTLTTTSMPWTYQFRSGSDLYRNGGFIRAMCDVSQTDAVSFQAFFGDVVQGEYGSQAVFNPGPNQALLPVTSFTVSAGALSAPTEVAPGLFFTSGGCNASDSCSFSGLAGPGATVFACTGTGLSVATTVEACSEQGCVTSTTLLGASVTLDYSMAGTLSCVRPDLSPAGPVQIVSMTGAHTFSLSFSKPRRVPEVLSSVVSTCQGLEANAQCRPVGRRCTAGSGETRLINGYPVYRECWDSELTFECKRPGGANTCAGLAAEPLCAQTSFGGCLQSYVDGSCLSTQATYRCTKDMASTGLPVLGTGYNILKDQLDNTRCPSLGCTKTSSQCLDNQDKTFSGFTFSRECWRYRDEYTCGTNNPGLKTCQGLVDNGCQLIPGSQACTNTLADGTCGTKQFVYQCGTPAWSTQTAETTCDASPYCINGVCYDTSRPADPDFASAVTAMETARQAGTYMDTTTQEVFKGEASSCRRKLFGLNNCCKPGKSSGGSWTNAALMNAGGKAVTTFGRKSLGSNYMYDALFADGGLIGQGWMAKSMESAGLIDPLGANAFNFDVYGFQFSWSSGGGIGFTGFDPWSFAASIALQYVLSELMNCDKGDQMTATKRGQELCHYMGSYCSRKLLFACQEQKESYCCFNSKLAKAINIQGKQQLGLPMGTAKNPQCGGLTVADIGSIDFARLDLREFLASIAPNPVSSSQALDNVAKRLGTYTPMAPAQSPPQPAVTSSADAANRPGVPADEPDPQVSVTITDPGVLGGTLEFHTKTSSASTLTYSCTGAWVRSGTLTVGDSRHTMQIPTSEAVLGPSVCMFGAANSKVLFEIPVTHTVVRPPPTVSASFNPSTIRAGETFTLTTSTTHANELTYSCSGARTVSGSLPTASYTSPVTSSDPLENGVVDCVFNVRSESGQAGSATAQQVVSPAVASVQASLSPSTVRVGQALSLQASAVNAVSVAYVCTGAVSQSGSAAGASLVASLVPSLSGEVSCRVSATTQAGREAQTSAQATVLP
jgi:conjugal transfer mating pair stabilization protein TraN